MQLTGYKENFEMFSTDIFECLKHSYMVYSMSKRYIPVFVLAVTDAALSYPIFILPSFSI